MDNNPGQASSSMALLGFLSDVILDVMRKDPVSAHSMLRGLYDICMACKIGPAIETLNQMACAELTDEDPVPYMEALKAFFESEARAFADAFDKDNP